MFNIDEELKDIWKEDFEMNIENNLDNSIFTKEFFFNLFSIVISKKTGIEYEIKNNTKDTIYLFTRLVEPFLEEKPFQIIQTQNSIEKFAKECGGRFVYEIIPSSNYFKKLNIEEDIVVIPPKGIEKMSIQRYADEGLCPMKGSL